jgi:hypothetical protein
LTLCSDCVVHCSGCNNANVKNSYCKRCLPGRCIVCKGLLCHRYTLLFVCIHIIRHPLYHYHIHHNGTSCTYKTQPLPAHRHSIVIPKRRSIPLKKAKKHTSKKGVVCSRKCEEKEATKTVKHNHPDILCSSCATNVDPLQCGNFIHMRIHICLVFATESRCLVGHHRCGAVICDKCVARCVVDHLIYSYLLFYMSPSGKCNAC